MAITVVQTKSGTALPLSFTSGVTAGNTVFLVVGCAPGSGTPSSSAPLLNGSPVTGSIALFNSGTTNGVSPGANSVYMTIWMLPNVPGGGTSLNLTLTNVAGVTGAIAYEVSGLGAAPAVDKFSTGANATSAAVDSGNTGAIAKFPEFVIGAAQIYNQSGAGPAGWTSVAPNNATWAGYQIATAAGGSYDWAQTAGSSGAPWAAGAATIAPASAHSRTAALSVTPTLAAVARGPLKYVNLTLDLYDGSGNAISPGTAIFTPSTMVTDAGVQVVGQTPVMAAFRPGLPTVAKLLATDNSQLSPSGWTWQVQFQGIPGAPASFNFFLPFSSGTGANQNLSSLVPVSAGTAMQGYLPLPSGTALAGQVPVATGSGSNTTWRTLASTGGTGTSPVPVTITCTGATFSPKIILAAGSTATVTWILPDGSTVTGLTPTLNFGGAGTYLVRMIATDVNGNNALGQINTFNIGYNSTFDASPYSLDATYNWTSQSVSGISNVNAMTGLVNFLAEGIPALTGTLDFSGMAWLQRIDTYGSQVQAANINGCESLIRLDIEQNKMTTVNLNPVAPYLYDMRFAAQQGGALTFANQAIPLVNLFHFCVRDQVITNMPNFVTQMPHINQLWIWNTGQSGTLQTASDSLTNLQALLNSYTSANLANQFVTGTGGYLDLSSNHLASITLTGCTSLFTVLLQNNLLPQAQVDGVLAVLAGTSISNGTVNVGGTGNAAPSAAGLTSAATLTGRGWTVTHN